MKRHLYTRQEFNKNKETKLSNINQLMIMDWKKILPLPLDFDNLFVYSDETNINSEDKMSLLCRTCAAG